MKNQVELNSDNCFNSELESQLVFFGVEYLSKYTNSKFVLAMKMIEGGEIGMGVIEFEKYVYGLTFYSGYLRFIYDGLYIILSDENLFDNIGYSSHTMKTTSLRYNGSVNYFDYKPDLFLNEKAKFDIERVNLHLFFYKISTTLITLHECHHILNGHTGFLKSDIKNRSILTQLDLHTLEMDADSCAIKQLFYLIIANKDYFNVPKSLNNEEGILSSIVFTMSFLFFIIPHKSLDSVNDMKHLSHPSNGFRFLMMLGTLMTVFDAESKNELSNMLPKIFQSNINDLNKTVSTVSGEKIDIYDLKFSSNEESEIYLSKILANWNNLRPILEPFAFRKLAPYTQDYIRKNISHDIFCLRLYEFKIAWLSSLYSNSLLFNHLNNKLDCPASLGIIKINGGEPNDKTFILSMEKISNEIITYSKIRNESFTNTGYAIWQQNAQFLRSKVLNETFEFINYYFEDSPQIEKLKFHDWYRVLSVLSDNSLYKSRFKPVTFPTKSWKTYEIPSITWNDITIFNGQLGENILYNDNQVNDLLDFIGDFFNQNQDFRL